MKFTKQLARLMNLFSAVSFLIALVLNGLANILPINGLETGVISDTYANYFAPIGLTFSIWALIYTVLAIYVGWRLKKFADKLGYPVFDVVSYQPDPLHEILLITRSVNFGVIKRDLS